jgi:hypothetical protein
MRPVRLIGEALVTGLKCRIADMQGRLDRLQDRAFKRRQVAKDVMVELDLKKITAPDFTVLIRPGTHARIRPSSGARNYRGEDSNWRVRVSTNSETRLSLGAT